MNEDLVIKPGVRMALKNDPKVTGTITKMGYGYLIWEADQPFTIEYNGKIHSATRIVFRSSREARQKLDFIDES
ncbi:MAG: hypothetical protein HPY81_09500 [Firmicutes bacterium]|nr:hypothetical protein [Bacillota bacterium]